VTAWWDEFGALTLGEMRAVLRLNGFDTNPDDNGPRHQAWACVQEDLGPYPPSGVPIIVTLRNLEGGAGDDQPFPSAALIHFLQQAQMSPELFLESLRFVRGDNPDTEPDEEKAG
jgi:hypothetical protein